MFEQFRVPRKYARPLARSRAGIAGDAGDRAAVCPGSSRNLKVNARIIDLLEPAGAAAGVDHGLSLPGRGVSLFGQRPDRPLDRQGAAFVAEDRGVAVAIVIAVGVLFSANYSRKPIGNLQRRR